MLLEACPVGHRWEDAEMNGAGMNNQNNDAMAIRTSDTDLIFFAIHGGWLKMSKYRYEDLSYQEQKYKSASDDCAGKTIEECISNVAIALSIFDGPVRGRTTSGTYLGVTTNLSGCPVGNLYIYPVICCLRFNCCRFLSRHLNDECIKIIFSRCALSLLLDFISRLLLRLFSSTTFESLMS